MQTGRYYEYLPVFELFRVAYITVSLAYMQGITILFFKGGDCWCIKKYMSWYEKWLKGISLSRYQLLWKNQLNIQCVYFILRWYSASHSLHKRSWNRKSKSCRMSCRFNRIESVKKSFCLLVQCLIFVSALPLWAYNKVKYKQIHKVIR